MTSIGEKIRNVRSVNQLTQTEFGETIYISQSHLSKIEHSIENPSRKVIKLISLLYNVDEKWLEQSIK